MNWRHYAAEALGTFALVAIGTGAAMVSTSTSAFGAVGVSLAFGAVVTVIVASIGRISGAHVNPAVTIGLWTQRRFSARQIVPYIVAQCMGAILASFALCALLGPVGNLGATIPTVSVARAFAIEMGYSGVLGFAIMAVSDERSPAHVAPFVLGVTVFLGALVTGPLTGGSFNPARSLGPALVGGVWTAHWVYWLAPIVGVSAGMWLHRVVRAP